MAKRPTLLDKAIQNLDAQIAVLQAARQQLVQQPRTVTAKPAPTRIREREVGSGVTQDGTTPERMRG
jgi:hypothetical protein